MIRITNYYSPTTKRGGFMAEKIPATINEQIAILKERGCEFEDENAARETLRYINYFRLSNYFEPFSVSKHKYEDGTTFGKIMRIYEMDKKMRSILLAALESVEIALRASVSNFHALKYGAQGYLNGASFGHSHNHKQFLHHIEHLIDSNSDRAFVKHYNAKHSGHFPLWVIMELFSFGTLAFFYKDMHMTDKKELSARYYNCSAACLDSWVFCLSELRNYCAHYNRLYGNRFTVIPKKPADYSAELSNDVWSYIIVLKQLYHNKDNWNERAAKPISRLIRKNADIIRLSDLGFPEDWESLLRFSEK